MTKQKTQNKLKGEASPGSKTSQPQKALNKSVNKKPKTPKSEPQPKRKKLSEEISDDEFEKLIKDVKADELKKSKEGRKTPRPKSPKKGGSEDEEESSDDSDFDIDAIQFDSDDDANDSSDDNDAEGSEDEEADSDDSAQEKTNPLADKFKQLINGKDGMYSDDSSDDEDEDEDGSEQDSEDGESGDSDEDEDSEEESTPGKKSKQKAMKKLKQATKQESEEESGDESDMEDDVPKPSKKSKKQKDNKDQKATKKETGVKRKADEDASGEPKAKLTKSDLMADQKARDEQNSRSLFLMLPGQLSQDEVRELLPKPMRSKITDVRIHTVYRKKKKAAGKQVVRAYLEFNTVEQVDKAFAALKDAKLKNEPIIVDYVGTKSLNKPTPANTERKIKPSDFDPLRLFIGGFDRDPSTEEELKEHFPTASKLQCPKPKDKNKLVGFAFAHYTSEVVCKAAHEQNQNLVLRDRKLRVMFARKASAAAKAGHKTPKPPKKAAGENQSPTPEKQQTKKQKKKQKQLNNKKDSQEEKKVEKKSPQEERKKKKKSGKKAAPVQEVIDDITMSD